MAFTQGISGLQAAAADLNNIGNNIANSQTTGYKTGQTQFADIYAGARTGLGVSVAGTRQDFANGSLNNTGRDLDFAIDGSGFFRMADGNQTVYSRDGGFTQTKNGNLANSSGALLTGYNVSNFNNPNTAASVNASGNPQIIQIPQQDLSARATQNASLPAALDAGAKTINTSFNANDASSYNWSTPNTVYDSLGNAHSLNTYFTKTGENQWQVNGQMVLGQDANLATSVDQSAPPSGFALNLSSFQNSDNKSPATAGNGTYTLNGDNGKIYTAHVSGAQSSGSGYTGGTVTYTESLPKTELSFDNSGNLEQAQPLKQDGSVANKDSNLGDSQVNYALNAQNGSAPIGFKFDFAGSTQTAQSFAAGNPSQDGYASGALTGISVQNNGTITGSYANGQSENLAQLALAGFANEQGLAPVSGNAWKATSDSGQAALGSAGSGQLGTLRGKTLEKSNVDLSKQLVNMIVSQRNYQANAQTIKTQSQVLQTAVNLGR